MNCLHFWSFLLSVVYFLSLLHFSCFLSLYKEAATEYHAPKLASHRAQHSKYLKLEGREAPSAITHGQLHRVICGSTLVLLYF